MRHLDVTSAGSEPRARRLSIAKGLRGVGEPFEYNPAAARRVAAWVAKKVRQASCPEMFAGRVEGAMAMRAARIEAFRQLFFFEQHGAWPESREDLVGDVPDHLFEE